jgi:hypothetical protein
MGTVETVSSANSSKTEEEQKDELKFALKKKSTEDEKKQNR